MPSKEGFGLYVGVAVGSQRTIRALVAARLQLMKYALKKTKSIEMKAVFSIDRRGMISMSCWHAISSSSGGVTDVRSD